MRLTAAVLLIWVAAACASTPVAVDLPASPLARAATSDQCEVARAYAAGGHRTFRYAGVSARPNDAPMSDGSRLLGDASISDSHLRGLLPQLSDEDTRAFQRARVRTRTDGLDISACEGIQLSLRGIGPTVYFHTIFLSADGRRALVEEVFRSPNVANSSVCMLDRREQTWIRGRCILLWQD